MPTKLRMARFGCKRRPFYRIVATDSRKARNGQPIEYVGTYDPMPRQSDGFKELRLKVDRVKYWLSTGAQPSDTVAKLLWRAGLAPPPPIPFTTKRHIKKSEREYHTGSSSAWAVGGAARILAMGSPALGLSGPGASRTGVVGRAFDCVSAAGVVRRPQSGRA